MPGAHETLEHMEHAAHAGGHGDHGGHGHDRFGTFVGITMATLGVLLAFAAARVGGERTELVQTLVEQQNAHTNYRAADTKHRMAVLSLTQAHAGLQLDATGAPVGAGSVNKNDVVFLAQNVERYLRESTVANTWTRAFDPAVKAHVEAQEHFENAQLLAEIGIVVASVALLLKRRAAWFVSLALGAGAVLVMLLTWLHTGHAVHDAEHAVEHAEGQYHALRAAGKTTDDEKKMVSDVLKWAGVEALPAPAVGGHDEHGPGDVPKGDHH